MHPFSNNRISIFMPKKKTLHWFFKKESNDLNGFRETGFWCHQHNVNWPVTLLIQVKSAAGQANKSEYEKGSENLACLDKTKGNYHAIFSRQHNWKINLNSEHDKQ